MLDGPDDLALFFYNLCTQVGLYRYNGIHQTGGSGSLILLS